MIMNSWDHNPGARGKGALTEAGRSGVALVMVLGFLALLMIMAVAFAISMRTERLVSRAALHETQTSLMLDAAASRTMFLVDTFMNDEDQYFPDFRLVSGDPDVWGVSGTGADRVMIPDCFYYDEWIPSDLWDAVDEQSERMGWTSVTAGGEVVGRWAGLVINNSGLLDVNRIFSYERTNDVQRKNLYLSKDLLDEFRQDEDEEDLEKAFVYNRDRAEDRWVRAVNLGEVNSFNAGLFDTAARHLFTCSYFPEETFSYGDSVDVQPLILKNWYTDVRWNGWDVLYSVWRDDQRTELRNRLRQMLEDYVAEGNELTSVADSVESVQEYMDRFHYIRPHGAPDSPLADRYAYFSQVDSSESPMLNEIGVRRTVTRVVDKYTVKFEVDLEMVIPYLAVDRDEWGYAEMGGRAAEFHVDWRPVNNSEGWDFGDTSKDFGYKNFRYHHLDEVGGPDEASRLYHASLDFVSDTKTLAEAPAELPGLEIVCAYVLWRRDTGGAIQNFFYDAIPFRNGTLDTAVEVLSPGSGDESAFYECVDPRFNHLWNESWREVDTPSPGAMNEEARRLYSDLAGGKDGHWSMRRGSRVNDNGAGEIRYTRFENISGLGGAAYDVNRPWETVPLVGERAMPVFEYLRLCEDEGRYHRRVTNGVAVPDDKVSLLTRREGVLGSAFYNRGADRVQDEMRLPRFGTNTISAAEARALARVMINRIAEAEEPPANTFEALRLVSYEDLIEALPPDSIARNKHSIDRLIGQIYDLLHVRQNLFTVLLGAQKVEDRNGTPGIQSEEILGEKWALAVIWRDPLKTDEDGHVDENGLNRMKPLFFHWLDS
ncbi:hypothetical protein [Kiritimatiella glycovorans]|uniref:Uncharacterized protein n=1 Tax=Kiritimatiella glycovorans TaxID=1307763 RepID=A0A0G3EJ17_9BACT|nr:hypothetical protein [Kiritimatiella glycovorans]AKJ65422.1 hypothetical protein L21SP4_02195 [Kiritimatiella glycovorans]